MVESAIVSPKIGFPKGFKLKLTFSKKFCFFSFLFESKPIKVCELLKKGSWRLCFGKNRQEVVICENFAKKKFFHFPLTFEEGNFQTRISTCFLRLFFFDGKFFRDGTDFCLLSSLLTFSNISQLYIPLNRYS